MNELIEGKFVTVRKLESNKVEMGMVKRLFSKLMITVKRNNSMVNLTPEVLELYEVSYVSDEMIYDNQ